MLLSQLRGCLCCYDIFIPALTLIPFQSCIHQWYDASTTIVQLLSSLLSSLYSCCPVCIHAVQLLYLLSRCYSCCPISIPGVQFLYLLSRCYSCCQTSSLTLIFLPLSCCFIPYFAASFPTLMLLSIIYCIPSFYASITLEMLISLLWCLQSGSKTLTWQDFWQWCYRYSTIPLFHSSNLQLFDSLSNRILLNVLFSTAYNTLLYFSPLCTVLYCTILYCTVLYCTVLYCTVLYCTIMYCTIKYFM